MSLSVRLGTRGLGALLVGVILFFAPTTATAGQADAPALNVRYTEAAGTTFAWAALGEGPTLLLLNGTASPMNEWDPTLLSTLSVNRRVMVLDYPGLGLSGSAPQPWDFSRAAEWIEGFLNAAMGDEPVDVLGWSMGGFIAQRLALQHPERVRALILAATNPGGDAAALGPRWVQEADSSGGERAYLITNFPSGQRDAGRRFIDRLESAVESGSYPEETVPSATARAMVRAEDPWLRSNANTRELAQIDMPTLVITGRSDVITPPINSRRIAERLPHSRLVLVDDAGHSFLFQQPKRAAATFHDFLTAATSSSP